MAAVIVVIGMCVLAAADVAAAVKVINGSPRIMNTAPSPAGKQMDTSSHETWVATKAILRDAKTGTLRKPTEAETRELVRTLRELTAKPAGASRRVISANGAVQATAEAASPQVLVARATADGQNETLCVSSFEEAANFLGLARADRNE